jgi:3-hydroxyisobutyrate dehydrogenase
MAGALAHRGVTLIDAPVSGGVTGATTGAIAIMVGASDDDFGRSRALLSAISSHIFHAGDVGCGQVMKLANNMISAAQRLVTLEGIALAAKNGIDPHIACEILCAGGARNAFLEGAMTSRVLTGDVQGGFTLGLMHKDVRLACELGDASGVPMAFGTQTCDVYQYCMDAMGPEAGVLTAALIMDRLAGTPVVPVASSTTA